MAELVRKREEFIPYDKSWHLDAIFNYKPQSPGQAIRFAGINFINVVQQVQLIKVKIARRGTPNKFRKLFLNYKEVAGSSPTSGTFIVETTDINVDLTATDFSFYLDEFDHSHVDLIPLAHQETVRFTEYFERFKLVSSAYEIRSGMPMAIIPTIDLEVSQLSIVDKYGYYKENTKFNLVALILENFVNKQEGKIEYFDLIQEIQKLPGVRVTDYSKNFFYILDSRYVETFLKPTVSPLISSPLGIVDEELIRWFYYAIFNELIVSQSSFDRYFNPSTFGGYSSTSQAAFDLIDPYVLGVGVNDRQYYYDPNDSGYFTVLSPIPLPRIRSLAGSANPDVIHLPPSLNHGNYYI